MQIKLANIHPISYAAAHLAQMIEQAITSGDPTVITQKGRPTAVVLSVEQFTRLKQAAANIARPPLTEAELSTALGCEG